MLRLTASKIEQILQRNNGFKTTSNYNSRNHSYSRIYEISSGDLYITEDGKTSWADSRYHNEWVASSEEIRRFIHNYALKLNLDV